jgi:hypothetical protein
VWCWVPTHAQSRCSHIFTPLVRTARMHLVLVAGVLRALSSVHIRDRRHCPSRAARAVGRGAESGIPHVLLPRNTGMGELAPSAPRAMCAAFVSCVPCMPYVLRVPPSCHVCHLRAMCATCVPCVPLACHYRERAAYLNEQQPARVLLPSACVRVCLHTRTHAHAHAYTRVPPYHTHPRGSWATSLQCLLLSGQCRFSHLTHTLTPSLSSPLIPSQLSLFSPSREKLPSLFYIMF